MNSTPHILVIDDEPHILRALRTILSAHHYKVTTAKNGEDGLAFAAVEKPDMVILDLGLPDIDGVTVCARLREWTDIPIIVLSVREGEREKVRALDNGADDYLVKPFGIDELLARIRVALRHLAKSQGFNQNVVVSGDITIDLIRHIVTKEGNEIKLTATEYKLLTYLAIHADRVLTHLNILDHVWGPEYLDNVEYLRVFMSQLRKKLETDPKHPKYIFSESGIGYRFITQE
jgi:two-component system KDP operon response regulator KdpE